MKQEDHSNVRIDFPPGLRENEEDGKTVYPARSSTTVLVCPTRHVVEEIERVQIFTMIRSRWLHLEI